MKKICILALLGALAAPGCLARTSLGIDDLFDDIENEIEEELNDMRKAYGRLRNNLSRAIDSGVNAGLSEYRQGTGRTLQRVFGTTAVSISSASNGEYNIDLKKVIQLEEKRGGKLVFSAPGISAQDIVVKVSSGKIVVQERIKPHGSEGVSKAPHVYVSISVSPPVIKHKE
ncbi:hypothetical protein HOD08_00320, partial [bacterium]|nr:hypothetical protein [bacterium]